MGKEICDMEYAIIALLALLVIAVAFLAICVKILLERQNRAAETLEDIKLAFAGELKELNKALADLLTETKNTNRHLAEQLALKEAEMTGDFEIVEEPIAPKKPVKRPPTLKTKPVQKIEPEVKLAPPPQSFPSI